MGDDRQPFLTTTATSPYQNQRNFSRCVSHARDELHSFRTWLTWLCVDQSNAWTTCLSWFVFIVFAISVPALSHFVLNCSECDGYHSRPYDSIAQLSLSGVATLSFLCLSTFVRRFGLRRFLFFDKLRDESESVRKDYTLQFNRSLKILFIFVVPCFGAEATYKIWWYISGGTRIPFLGNVILSNTVACILELCSWFYRTLVFFLVCILFRLICYLQILRMQDFARVFQGESDVESVLREHLRIRRHLKVISHRYRVFILWSLVLITASQFTSLFVTVRPDTEVNIYLSGELVVCSLSLVAGLLILLRSAARITHKAQSVTSLAAKWHVCATIDSFDSVESETPAARGIQGHTFLVHSDGSADHEDVSEDELDNTKLVHSHTQTTISFQKRQALVTYFENNRAGITIYGFMLDRSYLHTIFGIELSLVLWILGKTIAFS